MFEKYTEKARRVIFFARYEAAQAGSPYITTPHLLLGILREDKRLISDLLPGEIGEATRLAEEVRATFPGQGQKISTTVDLPLNEASKRVLRNAATESEKRGHNLIGSVHLLYGLLQEDGPETAAMKSHGLDMAALETTLSAEQLDPEQVAATEPSRFAALSHAKSLYNLMLKMPKERIPALVAIATALAEPSCEIRGSSSQGTFQFSFGGKTE
jgi:ATP-dependent Clp protease ATP-binding subunit ClpC